MALIKIGKKETLIPEGYYEVFVNKYDEVDKSNPAFEASRIMFTVRNDLESMEEFAGKNLFANIRDTWDWIFPAIGHAVKLPEDTEFDDLNSFLVAIKGSSLKVKVAHKEYNGNTYANIKAFIESDEPEYVVPMEDALDNIEDSII